MKIHLYAFQALFPLIKNTNRPFIHERIHNNGVLITRSEKSLLVSIKSPIKE